jgi:hypothetical protein
MFTADMMHGAEFFGRIRTRTILRQLFGSMAEGDLVEFFLRRRRAALKPVLVLLEALLAILVALLLGRICAPLALLALLPLALLPLFALLVSLLRVVRLLARLLVRLRVGLLTRLVRAWRLRSALMLRRIRIMRLSFVSHLDDSSGLIN